MTIATMTTNLLAATLSLTFLCAIDLQSASTGADSSTTQIALPGVERLLPAQDYSVVETGPHHRVVSRVSRLGDANGQAILQTNSYVELATGMNFLNERGGWEESKEEIEVLTDDSGAAALHGQHKVTFPPDIYEGRIKMSLPDGKWLVSRVLGLSYFDASDGRSVLIAEITNSVGEIHENVVIYPRAFTDVQASLRYTYTREGFEQDVILDRAGGLPKPEEFGLNPETTRLQVLTEFFDPPTPTKTERRVVSKSGEELTDHGLSFNQMEMASGKAFCPALESEEGVSVAKQWVRLEGRDFLIEEVQIKDVLHSHGEYAGYMAREQLPARGNGFEGRKYDR